MTAKKIERARDCVLEWMLVLHEATVFTGKLWINIRSEKSPATWSAIL